MEKSASESISLDITKYSPKICDAVEKSRLRIRIKIELCTDAGIERLHLRHFNSVTNSL